jgi:hypothetical protein
MSEKSDALRQQILSLVAEFGLHAAGREGDSEEREHRGTGDRAGPRTLHPAERERDEPERHRHAEQDGVPRAPSGVGHLTPDEGIGERARDAEQHGREQELARRRGFVAGEGCAPPGAPAPSKSGCAQGEERKRRHEENCAIEEVREHPVAHHVEPHPDGRSEARREAVVPVERAFGRNHEATAEEEHEWSQEPGAHLAHEGPDRGDAEGWLPVSPQPDDQHQRAVHEEQRIERELSMNSASAAPRSARAVLPAARSARKKRLRRTRIAKCRVRPSSGCPDRPPRGPRRRRRPPRSGRPRGRPPARTAQWRRGSRTRRRDRRAIARRLGASRRRGARRRGRLDRTTWSAIAVCSRRARSVARSNRLSTRRR